LYTPPHKHVQLRIILRIDVRSVGLTRKPMRVGRNRMVADSSVIHCRENTETLCGSVLPYQAKRILYALTPNY
jgi:hypothetical protein